VHGENPFVIQMKVFMTGPGMRMKTVRERVMKRENTLGTQEMNKYYCHKHGTKSQRLRLP